MLLSTADEKNHERALLTAPDIVQLCAFAPQACGVLNRRSMLLGTIPPAVGAQHSCTSVRRRAQESLMP
jgi:hypothetical protein